MDVVVSQKQAKIHSLPLPVDEDVGRSIVSFWLAEVLNSPAITPIRIRRRQKRQRGGNCRTYSCDDERPYTTAVQRRISLGDCC
jgi:hypothetical protein